MAVCSPARGRRPALRHLPGHSQGQPAGSTQPGQSRGQRAGSTQPGHSQGHPAGSTHLVKVDQAETAHARAQQQVGCVRAHALSREGRRVGCVGRGWGGCRTGSHSFTVCQHGHRKGTATSNGGGMPTRQTGLCKGTQGVGPAACGGQDAKRGSRGAEATSPRGQPPQQSCRRSSSAPPAQRTARCASAAPPAPRPVQSR
jgi:hypothetical protein